MEQSFQEVQNLCEKALQDGVFPGCVVSVGRNGSELFKQAFGLQTLIKDKDKEAELPRMKVSTVFDIASVTTLITTAVLMRLVDNGRISLNDHISRYIQSFGVNGKSNITIRQLLNHTSGLPAWHAYFEELVKLHLGERRGILTSSGAKDYIFNLINRSQVRSEPGSKQVYSEIGDNGFILAGNLIETITGQSLDKAVRKYVTQPLGMQNTSYIDLALIRRRGILPVKDLIAPTENCPWRKRILCGEVQDGNAWAMGGIAGHSGIFSDAEDLHIFASQLLQAYNGGSSFLSAGTVRDFFQLPEGFSEGWCCGFDMPSKENGLSDSRISASSVGINGFTGCSLWMDLERGIDIVLLSNSIHPSEANRKIKGFRPILFDAIIQAVER